MSDAKQIFTDPEVASFKVRYQRGRHNIVRNHVRCGWCGGNGFDMIAPTDIDICNECSGTGFIASETKWEDD